MDRSVNGLIDMRWMVSRGDIFI